RGAHRRLDGRPRDRARGPRFAARRQTALVNERRERATRSERRTAMRSTISDESRRHFLVSAAAMAAAQMLPGAAGAQDRAPTTRPIPGTSERLPVIGLGTWITFNVAPTVTNEAPLVPVMRTFFERGGAMI